MYVCMYVYIYIYIYMISYLKALRLDRHGGGHGRAVRGRVPLAGDDMI